MEEVIQTRRIEIVDSAGKVRAILGTRIPDIGPGMQPEEGPVLAFLTPAGRELVTFTLQDEGRESGGYSPTLYMKSENSELSVEVLCDNMAAMTRIGEAEGNHMARLGVSEGTVFMESSPKQREEGVEAIAA